MFDFMKAKETDSVKSKELLKNVVRSAGVDENQYTIVYACAVKGGVMSTKVSSHAVALSKDQSELLVIAMDTDGNCGEAQKIDTSTMSIKKTMKGAWKINSGDQEVEFGTFGPHTARNAKSMYMLPIRQEEEFKIVYDFLKDRLK